MKRASLHCIPYYLLRVSRNKETRVSARVGVSNANECKRKSGRKPAFAHKCELPTPAQAPHLHRKTPIRGIRCCRFSNHQANREAPMTRPTTTPPTLDHAAAADAVARAYAALASLDHLLARSGSPSWQSPRIHSLEAFAGLQRVGDALAAAAGPALRAIYRVPPAVAAPSAPAGEIAGPSPRQTDTGDDDRGASVLNGLSKGPTTANTPACGTREPEASPEHPRNPEAPESAATGV
jgi:hypothetical protein